MKNLPTSKDKLLFTPGPLTTSQTVNQEMLRDLGSRDVEAVMTSAIPRDGKWLIVMNGAYKQRMKKIAAVHGIPCAMLSYDEDQYVSAADVDRELSNDPSIFAVAVVYWETTTGIMNPIEEVGSVVRKHGRKYFVDSMSAFDAVQFDFQTCEIDYLVSSANKCIEGVPVRYQANCNTLLNGMRNLGFEEYLPSGKQGHIITSFLFPQDRNFNFETFYEKLNDRGFVIYPGKVSNANCFRIGNIGRIFKSDVSALVSAVAVVLAEMQVQLKMPMHLGDSLGSL